MVNNESTIMPKIKVQAEFFFSLLCYIKFGSA